MSEVAGPRINTYRARSALTARHPFAQIYASLRAPAQPAALLRPTRPTRSRTWLLQSGVASISSGPAIICSGCSWVHSNPEVHSRSRHPSAGPPIPSTDTVAYFPPVILRWFSPRDHDQRRTGQRRQPQNPRLPERSVGNGANIGTIVGSAITAEDITRSQRMNTSLSAKRVPSS